MNGEAMSGTSRLRGVLSHPSALLLAVQMLGIVVYPFIDGHPLERAMFETFAILVLALVVNSISAARWVVWSAVVLGLAGGAFAIADALSHQRWLVVAGGVLHAFLYLATGGSLLRYMFGDQRVTRDELFAVGAAFTVFAWAFAYVYVVTQALDPGAFGTGEAGAPRSWLELLFLSVTTLTSTGLSDIVPVTVHARSAVMVEQIAGLGYVALVVSTIVGMTMRRSRNAGGD